MMRFIGKQNFDGSHLIFVTLSIYIYISTYVLIVRVDVQDHVHTGPSMDGSTASTFNGRAAVEHRWPGPLGYGVE